MNISPDVNAKTFIIAEAGVNHNGQLDLAHKLIDAAKSAGADAVKFQTFHAGNLASRFAPRADYQSRQIGSGDQIAMLRNLELRPEWHAELFHHCQSSQIEFMSTPFHASAADIIAPFVRRFKIGSGDLTDLALIEHVAGFGKPVILSTGMATYSDIEPALDILRGLNIPTTIMHCSSLYPTPFEAVNLRAIRTLGTAFGLPVGYSDHTVGLTIAIAAVAMGALVIEKHITLDRSMEGPDHAASLDPLDFGLLVQAVRNVEASMGDGIKRLMVGEDEIRLVARKSLTAARPLAAGTVLEAAMLCAKRPGGGIDPKDLKKICGKKVVKDLQADETLTWDIF